MRTTEEKIAELLPGDTSSPVFSCHDMKSITLDKLGMHAAASGSWLLQCREAMDLRRRRNLEERNRGVAAPSPASSWSTRVGYFPYVSLWTTRAAFAGVNRPPWMPIQTGLEHRYIAGGGDSVGEVARDGD